MTRKELQITFRVELLEDTHTGTGAGRLGIVDDTQSVDQSGWPVVWGSTLRGLLREAGEDWLLAREAVAQQSDSDPADIHSDRKILYQLFGSPINEQTRPDDGRPKGRCTVRSLRLKKPPAGSACLNWTATARDVHSRRPLDETLRKVEFAGAGLIFDGQLRLVQDDADHVRVLRKCLERLSVIGSGKTRGWGQVRVELTPSVPRTLPTPRAEAVDAMIGDLDRAASAGPVILHLLLRNLEPLNLTTTALAGNLNYSQSYLTGSTLRGALLHWISRDDAELGEALADPARLTVGNGYAVPKDIADQCVPATHADEMTDCRLLESLEVIPIPLSLREPKAGATERAAPEPGGTGDAGMNGQAASPPTAADATTDAIADDSLDCVPWWGRPDAADDRLGCRAELDAIAFTEPERLGNRKRIKSEDYLVRWQADRQWRRVRPKMGVLLRNRVPTSRLDPNHRGCEQQTGYQQDAFFSEQVLWEDQSFLTCLGFRGLDDAKRFCRAAAALLIGAENDRSWLAVGRGGRPLRVEAWHWAQTEHAPGTRAADKPLGRALDTQGPQEESDGKKTSSPVGLTITLTSDLIARTSWLTFRTDLTGVDIVQLVAEAAARYGLATTGLPTARDDVDRLLTVAPDRRVAEPAEVYGFNSATGLPRAAALAIKRGSVFTLLPSDGKLAAEALAGLRDALHALSQRGIGLGERTAEGFGRFAVDLDVHQPSYWIDFAPEKGPPGRDQGLRRSETVLARVLDFFDQLTKKEKPASDARGKGMPSVSQWQWLRHRAEVCRDVGQVEDVVLALQQHAVRLAGVDWQPLIKKIQEVIGNITEFEDKRLFLTALAQLAVADARRNRGKERRE